jgi:uncharacterized membrane protein
MSSTTLTRRFENRLAKILSYGTWLAWGTILLGGTLSALTDRITAGWGSTFVSAGIALFILLPVITLTMLLITFLKDRDYGFSAVAILVLAILFLSLSLGIISRGAPKKLVTPHSRHFAPALGAVFCR